MMPKKIKIIAIVGPTASGKSDLAVAIAKKLNGEIVSVDSRQIYKGMNIGSGKVSPLRVTKRDGRAILLHQGIPHYGLDIANPKNLFSVAQFQNYTGTIIKDITERGKIPILCGGTAHWMDAVALGQHFPEVQPNPKLRTELEARTTAELFSMLKKLDTHRANSIDPKNPRRLIRAIEIIKTTGAKIPRITQTNPYETTWIGIKPEDEILRKKITARLQKRLAGIITEIKKLHEHGLSWKKLEAFGLEYKYGSLYLEKKLTKAEMITQLDTAIWQYAKRQMTWWKRNQAITWFPDQDTALRKVH